MLLLAGILFSEMHQLVARLFPPSLHMQVDLFIKRGFSLKQGLLWYVHDTGDDIEWILFTFAFARIAIRVSDKLFKIAMLYFFYKCTQVPLYYWDYRQNVWTQYTLYALLFLFVVFWVLPDKKNKAKVINMSEKTEQ